MNSLIKYSNATTNGATTSAEWGINAAYYSRAEFVRQDSPECKVYGVGSTLAAAKSHAESQIAEKGWQVNSSTVRIAE